MKPEEIKRAVEESYRQIAEDYTPVQKTTTCCCGKKDSPMDYSIFKVDYTKVQGYHSEADLNLGCGIPTEYAGIRPGDHVLDLGSGAGNDCFVARTLTGPEGRVTGLDFTDTMIEKAKNNLYKTGYTNIDFIQGDIEAMPFPDNRFDVVLSNCVLNLVPDKRRAFREMYRVLKPGGHFCISDVVVQGHLPQAFREAAELYASCISGALQQEEYLEIIRESGFSEPGIHSSADKLIPEELKQRYMSRQEKTGNPESTYRLLSITVSATKPNE
jgi:ubiquinone/menaquinone biosynthesis C-methylase UbiE